MTNTKPTWEENFDKMFKGLTYDMIIPNTKICSIMVKKFIKIVEQEAEERGRREKKSLNLGIDCNECGKLIPMSSDNYILDSKAIGSITHGKCP